MKLVPAGMARSMSRHILKMRKNSPRTLFVLGISGTVVSTVLACRATLKLEETVDEFKEEVDLINSRDADQDDSTHRRELAYVYAKGTWSIVKLYGPSVIVSVASMTALTKSHLILSQRNAALTAAYSAMSTAFEAYRGRVAEEIGVEKERDLYLGVVEEVTKGEGGKKEIAKLGPGQPSMYARWFEEKNLNWVPSTEANRNFLQCQQHYANHLLASRGHVFLQEVYDMLGLERAREAQVVGWIYKSERGDGYIDFGIYNNIRHPTTPKGFEGAILLDFNVDGTIWDKI